MGTLICNYAIKYIMKTIDFLRKEKHMMMMMKVQMAQKKKLQKICREMLETYTNTWYWT